MKSFRFHHDARAEFRASVRYFETQQRGLGRRFQTHIDNALKEIQANPTTGIIEGEFRLKSVRPFSYWIVFTERNKHIWIIAIHHGRRDDAHWRTRLNDLADEEG